MTITLDNPLQIALGLCASAVIGWTALKYGRQASASNSLETAVNELKIERGANERLRTENNDLGTKIAAAETKIQGLEKQVSDLTSLIRGDTPSPALLAILDKMSSGSLAQYTAAILELKHFCETEFKALNSRIDMIQTAANDFAANAERRADVPRTPDHGTRKPA